MVGNSTELKNVVIFNSVQVPHYNYVGDSILGYKSHMGAGSITSNVKSDKTLVVVKDHDEKIETGLKKFGAMLGDYVEVGCNSVLNPGTVIGSHTNVYPLSSVAWRGSGKFDLQEPQRGSGKAVGQQKRDRDNEEKMGAGNASCRNADFDRMRRKEQFTCGER